jgi:hypothetical protein
LALGWTTPFLDFCQVWSGGRPRDLVRVARELADMQQPDAPLCIAPCVAQIVTSDFVDRFTAVYRATVAVEGSPEVMALLDKLERLRQEQWELATLDECHDELLSWAGSQPDTTPFRLTRLAWELGAAGLVGATTLRYFQREVVQRGPLSDGHRETLSRAVRLRSVAPPASVAASRDFRTACLDESADG